MIVTAGSIWLALQVAPLQTVSAAGQTAQVGAAVPDFSLSGPGELDLFGQVVPTKPQFTGPIRPLLKLTHITIDDEVARLLRSDSPRTLELNLSQQLAQGWTRYFEWETLIAAGFAVVALAAVAGVGRQPYRKMAKTVVAGLVVVIAVNVGGVLLTASSTPRVLRSVKTLDDLVGADPLTAPQQAATRPLPGVQAVVIGDSTAAGHRQPASSRRHPAGPCLRPQQRVLRCRPGHGQQLERAEPGLQRRDRAERPARGAGARQRAGGAAAAR